MTKGPGDEAILRRRGATCAPLRVVEYSISAAAIAIFSLGFVIMGSVCALLSFRKKRDYLLRPASMFYAFAGRMGAPAQAAGRGRPLLRLPGVWATGKFLGSPRGANLGKAAAPPGVEGREILAICPFFTKA